MRRADWGWALLVIVIWGVNFVPMKLGLQELSPLLLSAMRFCLASLPLLLFIRKPASLTWRLLALYGLVQGVGQFGLLFAGLALGMPAGMASVVLQAQAFISMLLGALFLREQPKPWQWMGLIVASAGLGALLLALVALSGLLGARLAPRATPDEASRAQGEAMLAQQLADQQAFTRAADDIFLASSFLFLSLIVLIWFTKRPAPQAGGGADAAAGAH